MALAVWQSTIVNRSGDVQPNAQVEVRLESSGALAAIYADRDGNTPLGNPFAADENGFARFYAAGGAYKITASLGNFSHTYRHQSIGLLAEQDVATDDQFYYRQTAAEIAAGVTPVDYSYPELNVLRYGADPTNTDDSSAAIQAAIDVADAYPATGNGGKAVVYIPTGNYRIVTGLTIASASFPGIRGDGQYNSNLFPEGGITCLTIKSRGLYADFGIVGESKTDGNTGIACASQAQSVFRNVRCRRLENGAVMRDCWISRWYEPKFDGCGNALVLVGTLDLGWGAGSFACQDNKFFGGSWANNDYAIRLQGARNTIFYGPNIEVNSYGVVFEGSACLANTVDGAWVESTHKVVYVDTVSTGSASRNNSFSNSYVAINGTTAAVPEGGDLDEARLLHVVATGDGFQNLTFRNNYVVRASSGTTTVAVEVDDAASLGTTVFDGNFIISTIANTIGDVSAVRGANGDSLFGSGYLTISQGIDFGSVPDGGRAASNITLNGVALGDFVMVSPSTDVSGLSFFAYVYQDNGVKVVVTNHTGSPVDLSSITWRIVAWKKGNFGMS